MRKRRIPPMLADLVQMTLASFEGIVFQEAASCPLCGGELAGYDTKKRQFAVMVENGREKTVQVLVKRYRCRGCGRIIPAGQPFYPETRIGSPVIDLCLTLGETMPYGRVASCLAEMGVVVDRWSVRNYVQKIRHPVPSVDMFGSRVPLSIVSLSTVAMALPEGGRMDAQALLAACNNPSRIVQQP